MFPETSRGQLQRVACGILGLLLLTGCETEPPTPVVLTPAPAAPVAQAPAAEPVAAATPATTLPVPATPAAAQPSPPQSPAPAADQPMETKKAEAGVGVKGRDIPTQLGTTAIKQYFRIPEKTVFDIQIPSALNLYTAEKGHGPKTHDEFMEQIIKANQIALPQLPQGERYLWDPQKQELLVEHPKR